MKKLFYFFGTLIFFCLGSSFLFTPSSINGQTGTIQDQVSCPTLFNGLFDLFNGYLTLGFFNDFRPGIKVNQTTQEAEEFNWPEIKKAYDTFLNYPDEKNAYKLSSLLPNKKYHFNDGELAAEVTSYMIMDWYNYRTLEREAFFGNYFAAEAIYRLISISDAASTETLLDSLSTLIRIKPENLLGVLYENGWDNFRLEGIMHLALDLIDRNVDAHIYNYSMRIKAIESVSDVRFDYLKKRCISILQNEIEDIKKYREK